MTNAELESLIVLYLEGAASRQQVIRLRDAIKSSPELHQRFQARLRLHRAQMAYLSKQEGCSPRQAMLWLHGFAQRAGRTFAHLCLLALVLVELQVTIPAEYSGLLSYVDAPAAEEQVLGGNEVPLRLLTEAVQDLDLSQAVEVPDLTMPNLVLPEMAMPSEEPTSGEV